MESSWIPVRCSQAHSGQQYQVNKHLLSMGQISVWLDGTRKVNQSKQSPT